MGEIVDAFGDRAFGAVMLLFAMINMLPLPPGSTAVTGVPLLFLSLELALGRESLWLPGWLQRASLSRKTFQSLTGSLLKPVRFSEGLCRPRLHFMTGPHGQGLIGLACLFLSIVLVLPIWGGNLIPAIAIGLFALGVTQRDGVAVLLGWAVTALMIGVLVLAWRLIVQAFEISTAWISHLA